MSGSVLRSQVAVAPSAPAAVPSDDRERAHQLQDDERPSVSDHKFRIRG